MRTATVGFSLARFASRNGTAAENIGQTMRATRYPGRGRPPAVIQALDELVMLLQASISIANTERWALERGESAPPPALTGLLRDRAYEVTIVDIFHRLARRHFEQGGFRAVWERPFRTGARGRPFSVDLSLFDPTGGAERRVELGAYSKAKLEEDATKLKRLSLEAAVPGFGNVESFVALWAIRSDKLTSQRATVWMHTFKTDAAAVSANSTFSALPLLSSSVDLFAANSEEHRYATVGLFQVS
jgi:hypothetical protein